MWFWIIPALATLVVAGMLVAALRRGRAGDVGARESDMAVYKDQLVEVDRDLAKGVLTETEAEAVRIEVSRRLLDADKRRTSANAATREPARLGTGFLFLGVPLVAMAVYASIGAPGATDLPLDDRLAMLDARRAERPSQAQAEAQAAPSWPTPPEVSDEVADLAGRLRAVMSENPNDLEGLRYLARTEAQLGNYAQARAALERIVTVQATEAPLEDRLALVESMIFTAGGYVSPEAEAVLDAVITADATNLTARYYQGLLELQSGRADRTFPIWRRLLDVAPEDAPYRQYILAQLPAVAARAGVRYEPPGERGPDAADLAAAETMTSAERAALIEGMVTGLADRLATDGGPVQDWARLSTALGVLGRQDDAKAIAEEAATVFAGDPGALALIAESRAQAGVPE